jgi:hypothetical protein
MIILYGSCVRYGRAGYPEDAYLPVLPTDAGNGTAGMSIEDALNSTAGMKLEYVGAGEMFAQNEVDHYYPMYQVQTSLC